MPEGEDTKVADTAKASQETLGPSREPYWEEMSPDQKLTKLGEIVTTQQYRLDELLAAVAELSLPHEHLNGKMVREIHGGRENGKPGIGWLHGRDLLNRDPNNINTKLDRLRLR